MCISVFFSTNYVLPTHPTEKTFDFGTKVTAQEEINCRIISMSNEEAHLSCCNGVEVRVVGNEACRWRSTHYFGILSTCLKRAMSHGEA